MEPWFVTRVYPPDQPQAPAPHWHCHGHHHHHSHHGCGCNAPPPSNGPNVSAMLGDALDRVKGIPGTHTFEFTRTVEPEKKDPWAEYYEKLHEYYKTYPHMAPPNYHPPAPAPARHHCCHHH
ncbi:hypothetical protein EV183_004571 [Coemansia sp. RSA 2336]|nr:hypothetical protein EV183_004571 [Coemansia sp. RSA 2336]